MTGAEARYRRLFALYPRDFREEYGEEMLAVLMLDERRGPLQVLDLVRAALLLRLRQAAGAAQCWRAEQRRRAELWRRAGRVAQIFGALMLLAVALRRFLAAGLPAGLLGIHPLRVDPLDVLRVGAWGLALVAAVLALRLLGLAAAGAGLAGEIAEPARSYLETPATVLHAFWLIMTAAVVLVAGLVAVRDRARPRGLAVAAAAAGVLVLHGLFAPVPEWAQLVQRGVDPVRPGLPLLSGALLLTAVLRQEPVVRRRLLAWATPVLVTMPLVQSGFGSFIEHNMRHPEALRLLDPAQWTALVLVPVAAFVAVAAINQRFEAMGAGAR